MSTYSHGRMPAKDSPMHTHISNKSGLFSHLAPYDSDKNISIGTLENILVDQIEFYRHGSNKIYQKSFGLCDPGSILSVETELSSYTAMDYTRTEAISAMLAHETMSLLDRATKIRVNHLITHIRNNGSPPMRISVLITFLLTLMTSNTRSLNEMHELNETASMIANCLFLTPRYKHSRDSSRTRGSAWIEGNWLGWVTRLMCPFDY